MKNIIFAKSGELPELLKKVSIAKDKDSGFYLHLGKWKKHYTLSAICTSETMQSTSVIVVDWKGEEIVEGDKKYITELKEEVTVSVSALLKDAVYLLAETNPNIILMIEGSQFTAINKTTTVNIPVVGNVMLMQNPQKAKTIKVKIKKEVLIKGLPYINAGLTSVANSHYGVRYGIIPSHEDGKAVLHILASDTIAVVYDTFELIEVSENYMEMVNGLKYAMLPVDKISQIISSFQKDDLEITFFYNDDGITPRQVNLKCGNDNHQIMTHYNIYPESLKRIVDEGNLEYDCSFQLKASAILNAYNIASLDGSNYTDVEVGRKQVIIANHNGEKKTEFSGEYELNEGFESIHMGLSCEHMMHILKPFTGIVKIKGSNTDAEKRIVTVESGESAVRIGLCMKRPPVDIQEEDITSDGEKERPKKGEKAKKE